MLGERLVASEEQGDWNYEEEVCRGEDGGFGVEVGEFHHRNPNPPLLQIRHHSNQSQKHLVRPIPPLPKTKILHPQKLDFTTINTSGNLFKRVCSWRERGGFLKVCGVDGGEV